MPAKTAVTVKDPVRRRLVELNLVAQAGAAAAQGAVEVARRFQEAFENEVKRALEDAGMPVNADYNLDLATGRISLKESEAPGA